MSIKRIGLFLGVTPLFVLFTSCEAIFHGVVTPDQCKRCEVRNKKTSEVVWQEEGCGSGKANIEDKAKVEAYEQNNDEIGNFCKYIVTCETWKEEEDKEE